MTFSLKPFYIPLLKFSSFFCVLLLAWAPAARQKNTYLYNTLSHSFCCEVKGIKNHCVYVAFLL